MDEKLLRLAGHLIAYAVKKLYPQAKLGELKITEEKAYYEFEHKPFKAEDVERIEKFVEEQSGNIKLETFEVDEEEALNLLKDEPKKVLVKGRIKLVRINGFVDILEGSLPEQPKKVYVKILNTSSSFWKLTGKPMQRVWFVAFQTEDELKDYVKRLEELKKNDHRYIGEKLDLFHVEEEIVGSGLPLLHWKGTIIRNELIKFMREINDSLEFKEVWTPHLSKTVLWKISGHYTKYADKMFIWSEDEEEFGLKPMNCPLHIQIYKFKPRSYRDLPFRISEFATVYRKEQSGELHGLARVWSLTQDDHHDIVTPEQIKEETKKILKAAIKVYQTFGLEYKVNFSTKPEMYIGSDEIWEHSQKVLREVLEEMGLDYQLKEGEGAFYGPKIDFDVKDNMGRWWQLATIQLDFNLPERFDMTYVDKDGKEKRPVIIHFAILGSIERFMAMLIEHFKGKLPVWLSPVQVRLLPVSEKFEDEVTKLYKEFRELGIRVDVDSEGTVQYRVRNAEVEKVPYIIIIGQKEVETGTLAVRHERKIRNLSKDEFLKEITEKIKSRSL